MHVLVQSDVPAFDAGRSVKLTAVVQNDISGRGVNWRLEGVGCSACGTLTNVDAESAVYVPPAVVARGLSVRVIATAVANGLASGSATLSQAQPLVLARTLLPTGEVGGEYSASLAATGGLQPYLWTVMSGSLPDGLALDSGNGAISGVPAVAGTSSFVVQATDIAGASATSAVTVTVQDVMVGISPFIAQVLAPAQTVAFTAAVRNDSASRGVVWSIAGPSCGVRDCGMLTNVGPQSATYVAPGYVAENTAVSVVATAVADATRSAAEQMIVTGLSPGRQDRALNGHYAFLFRGYEASAVASAGSFLADGSGQITGGVMDTSQPAGITMAAPFSGRYKIGPDNSGRMTITAANGHAETFAFALGASSGGIAQVAWFVKVANGSRGSGVMRRQDAGAFTTAALRGEYAVNFSGETPPLDGGPAGPTAVRGMVTADGIGGLCSGVDGVKLVDGVAQNLTVRGNYLAPDVASGRTTAVFPAVGGPANLPQNYGIYVVSTEEALVISLDSRGQAAVLSGEMRRDAAIGLGIAH